MRFKNMTLHAICLSLPETGQLLIIPPSGMVAKVVMEEVHVEGMDILSDGAKFPVIRREPGEISIPVPEPGICYLVSSMVLDALKASGSVRKDIFAPDTGATAIRFYDGPQNGHVKAVTRLVTI